MKGYAIIAFLLLTILIMYAECTKRSDLYGIHYNKHKRSLIFYVDRDNIEMEVYWRDSLLCKPYINYYDNQDSCFIDIFPNNQIGGLNAKPYLLDICYFYSKSGNLPLRYVLIDRTENMIMFDTVIKVSNIIDDEVRERYNKRFIVDEPIVNSEYGGFNGFSYTNYYALTKGVLYSKGVRNIEDSILIKTSIFVDALENLGYEKLIIPKTPVFTGKIPTELSVSIPDSIPRIYLALASLSGKENGKDFLFETEQEIDDFVSKEYAYDFENAIVNDNVYIRVPITHIGNHKYNFIQILFVIFILNNKEYQYKPLGYIMTRDFKEWKLLYEEENLVKHVISPISPIVGNIIDNYKIIYQGNTDFYEFK